MKQNVLTRRVTAVLVFEADTAADGARQPDIVLPVLICCTTIGLA